MPSIKAIIFDCDGTLIDSEGSHFYAWQKVVLNRNHFFSLEDFIHCMGNAYPKIAELIAAKVDASSLDEILEEGRKYYIEHAKEGHPSIEPTVAFALKLASEKEKWGIKLAVASAGKKEVILHCLKEAGIDHLFDHIVCGQDDLQGYSHPEGVNKPNPLIYLHTAKLLGVEPSECVVVEDSLPGLTAGVRAGCFTVAIPTISTKIQDLSSADLYLESLKNMEPVDFFALVEEKIKQKKEEAPIVIFLNGTSSAGKTSLVHHLQEKLEKPFVHVGIDHFLFMLPSKYRMDGLNSHQGYHFKRIDDQEGAKISISKGPFAQKMTKVKNASILNLLDHKFNLIIDEVLFDEEDYQSYLELLKPFKVYFISIKPPLEVAEKREKARGGRMLGLARGLYTQVYQNKVSDLEIDTSKLTPEEAANSIIEYIQNNSVIY